MSETRIVFRIDYRERIAELHRTIVSIAEEQTGEGWRWELDELVASALNVTLLRQCYLKADDFATFNSTWQRARHEADALINGVEIQTTKAPILYDWLLRWEWLMRCCRDQTFVIGCLQRMGGWDFYRTVAPLLARTEVIHMVDSGVSTMARHHRIARQASMEMTRRFHDFPDIIQHMLGKCLAQPPLEDPPHQAELDAAIQQYLQSEAGTGHFGGERYLTINDLIHKQIAPLEGKPYRDQLEAIDETYKSFQYFPNRVHSRLEHIPEKERRQAQRFQSLNAPREGTEPPLIELIPASLVQTIGPSINMGKPLTDTQRKQVKAAFRKVEGANPETGAAIVEVMVKNGVNFTKTGTIKKSEIVAGLAEEGKKRASSTVGLYLGTKDKKGFIKQIADELVEILRWREE